jgi:SAM-dependent methyltransferase/uncharacterized protein YbaR (Trm112 family)
VRVRVLDLVACPRCGGGPLALATSSAAGDEILEGTLTCPGCGAQFPIQGGIPRLLPQAGGVPQSAQRTVDRFGKQWNDFDFIGPHYEKQFLGWIHPNGPESFAGQVVLEGGCGKGRHSALVARWGAKDVLAIDLGSAVDAAYRNTRDYPNVHVIQADLFHLPVRPGSVDTAFSVGVLHHTPDPRGAFRQLASRVRPGGRMIAWVYGAENNEWIVRYVDPVRHGITSRLPHRAVMSLSRLPAVAVWAASKGVYAPLSKTPLGDKLFYHAYMSHLAAFPFHEIHSIVHDHLTPPLARYIPRDEFETWFSELGLTDVSVSWHNQNSWRGTGYQPAASTTDARASAP